MPMTDTVGGICAACRDGWMADLDSEVGAFLAVVGFGERIGAVPVDLAPRMSAWFVKTALLRLARDGAVETSWAATAAQPLRSWRMVPPGWAVMVGSIDGGTRFGASTTAVSTAPAGDPSWVQVTYELNEVCVVIMAGSPGRLERGIAELVDRYDFADLLRPSGPVRLPRPSALDETGLISARRLLADL